MKIKYVICVNALAAVIIVIIVILVRWGPKCHIGSLMVHLPICQKALLALYFRIDCPPLVV